MGDSLSCILFQPPPTSKSASEKDIRAARSVGTEFIASMTGPNRPIIWLYTSLGHKIPAIFSDTKSKYTVLFSHGNAEDLSRISSWINVFSKAINVNTFAYDYPGYGLTKEGGPREHYCHAAAHAAYRYLIDIVGIPKNRIILYGRSLGGSVTAHLARRTVQEGCVPAGVVLQSTPLSAYRVILRVPRGCSIPGDRLETGTKLVGVGCPTLVIHGTEDGMVTQWHGQSLHNLIPKKYRVEPLWIKGAGHNNVEMVGLATGEIQKRLAKFLEEEVDS